MEKDTNEIDLLELSKNIMIRLYHYSLRRYKMLGIFILAGIVLGIFLYLKDKNRFETSIIANSELVKSDYIVEILNSLDDINSNKELISRILHLSTDEADNLLKIKADTMESRFTIKIKIQFKKDMNVSKLAIKIINYVDSNDYVKKEIILAKQRGIEVINKYNEEINRLDSLQGKILISDLKNSNNQLGNLLIVNDKVNNFFHKDVIELENQKQYEIRKLSRISGLLLVDAKSGVKIKEVSLIGTTSKLSLAMFCIGLFISLILEIKRKVLMIERSK